MLFSWSIVERGVCVSWVELRRRKKNNQRTRLSFSRCSGGNGDGCDDVSMDIDLLLLLLLLLPLLFSSRCRRFTLSTSRRRRGGRPLLLLLFLLSWLFCSYGRGEEKRGEGRRAYHHSWGGRNCRQRRRDVAREDDDDDGIRRVGDRWSGHSTEQQASA